MTIRSTLLLLSAWVAIAAPGRVLGQTAAAPDRWRVLVLRVDFPLEDPDELTTSGTGHFDLRTLAEALPEYESPYDTPPHDRAFHVGHLAALARYYDTVSEGRVRIEGEVFPRTPEAAYGLPGSALSYGNGRTTEEIGERWVRLIQDAVALAGADADGPTFSNFDSYLIIHAGLGHETGQLNDIRSVYLSPADLAKYNGGPIAADRGAHQIRDAWILPEVVHGGGRAGLNGLMAKFFGHQLGLPGLSNFADGVPALGGWSLMDIGANRLGFLLVGDELVPGFGFVPPHPMAWCKARMGWIQPLVVHRDTVVTVLATDRSAAAHGDLPRAVRVELSRGEYLLLENRQQRGQADLPGGVEAPYQGIELSWIAPDAVTFSHTIAAGESAGDSLLGRGAGIWAGVAEYDAFIPGSGMVVWHVDEEVIAANEAAGAINNDRERPGIWLVEADGERDIGNFYFDRQDRTEGTRDDPFHAGSGSGDAGVSSLGPDGPPDTRTNTGLATGVEVEVLSAPGDTMTVRITFRRALAGYPVPVVDGRRLQAVDADGDGASELVVGDLTGVHVRGGTGSRLLSGAGARLLAAGEGADAPVFTAGAEGIQAWQPARSDEALWTVPATYLPAVGMFVHDPGLVAAGPVLAVAGDRGVSVLDADTGQELVVAPGSYSGLALTDVDDDGFPDLVASGPDGGSLIAASGPQVLWTGDGQAPWPAVAGDLDADGRDELVVADASGQIYVHGTTGSRLLAVLRAPVAPPALGDVDGDGRLEVVVVSAEAVQVLRANGLPQAGFPAAAPAQYELGPLVAGPVLADLDGDGRQEVVVGADRGVMAFASDGTSLEGFPLLTAEAPVASPAAADLDGDGDLELAALTHGLVYAWEPAVVGPGYTGAAADWAQAGRTAAGVSAYPGQPAGPAPTPDQGLLVTGSAYCWPNPVGGGDAAHVRYRVSGAASAEVQVFDAVGERLERLKAQAPAAGEHEISWSIDGYASGLYLVRLKVRGAAGGSGETVIRMAVAR